MLVRAQGAWISDDEITRITQFIEQHSNVEFDETFNKKLSKIKEASLDGDDEIEDEETDVQDKTAEKERVKAEASASDFKKAVECIINTNRASTSHFQRRLGWGYNHAAKIMDMLEEAGVIAAQQGAGPRQIMMDRMQLMEVFNGGDAVQGEDAGEAPADETADLFTEEDQ
jgi:S-DNA-T family DNA segregation ATPase FtsK/SpoIIIE